MYYNIRNTFGTNLPVGDFYPFVLCTYIYVYVSPATTRGSLKTNIPRVDEPLPEFAERTLRMTVGCYSGMGTEWILVLAVDVFLMGCTDKRSARSALDRDP